MGHSRMFQIGTISKMFVCKVVKTKKLPYTVGKRVKNDRTLKGLGLKRQSIGNHIRSNATATTALRNFLLICFLCFCCRSLLQFAFEEDVSFSFLVVASKFSSNAFCCCFEQNTPALCTTLVLERTVVKL